MLYTFLFPLGKLGIPFLVFEKITKESFAPVFALLFIFLNFPYLAFFFFFL